MDGCSSIQLYHYYYYYYYFQVKSLPPPYKSKCANKKIFGTSAYSKPLCIEECRTLKCKVITLIFCHNLIFCHISSAIFVRAFQHLLNLGTVHYLHPGLVLKRYGLGNQVFDLLIGWVKKIKAVYQL
jgi:hypothetical protein